MTEAEWLAATSSDALSQYVRRDCQYRKLRLFAAACARRVLPFIPDPQWEVVAAAAESFADGEVTREYVKAVRRTVTPIRQDRINRLNRRHTTDDGLALHALTALIRSTDHTAKYVAEASLFARLAFGEAALRDNNVAQPAEEREQVRLARDIFGNPFRPVVFAPEWRTATAVGLADAIYAGRTFENLPILADALEEAGCDAADLLAHCRDTSLTHVRGCWAVDLVLGKA